MIARMQERPIHIYNLINYLLHPEGPLLSLWEARFPSGKLETWPVRHWWGPPDLGTLGHCPVSPMAILAQALCLFNSGKKLLNWEIQPTNITTERRLCFFFFHFMCKFVLNLCFQPNSFSFLELKMLNQTKIEPHPPDDRTLF